MPTISTLSGRSIFDYTGNCTEGFFLEYAGHPFITPQIINSILDHFQGTTVRGGFNMNNPTGFGRWVLENTPFSSKHASHIAAVLDHENLISHSFDGSRIILHFEQR